MNNYTQPYYMRNQYSYNNYQQPMYDPNMIQQQVVPQVQPQIQPIQNNNIQNYDFVGTFIKSYDDVKSNSFNCDKPLFLLDTANDKLYIKQMDNKGVPVISAFNVTPMQGDAPKSPEKNETDDLRKKINDMKKHYDEKIQELEQAIKTNNKSSKGDK